MTAEFPQSFVFNIDSVTEDMVIMPILGRIQFHAGYKTQTRISRQFFRFCHVGHAVVVRNSKDFNSRGANRFHNLTRVPGPIGGRGVDM